MSDGFGPPVLHDGKGCPVPLGTTIRVTVELWPDEFVTVVEVVQCAGAAWFWRNWLVELEDGDLCGRVVAYAIKRPRGLDVLSAIVADPLVVRPAPVPA